MDKLESQPTQELKLRVSVSHFLESLSSPLEEAVYYCSLPHWFNLNLISSVGLGGSDNASETIYDFFSRHYFVEDYEELGYTFNTTIRNLILDYLWHKDRKQYVQISSHLSHYFRRLGEEQVKEFETKEISTKQHQQLIEEYIRETIYHELIANEDEGIKELNYWLGMYKEQGKTFEYHVLLQMALEHQVAGRLSENGAKWLQFWEASDSLDTKGLEDMAIHLSDTPKHLSEQLLYLDACVNYSLSNRFASAGDRRKSWVYFYKYRHRLQNINIDHFKPLSFCGPVSPLYSENLTPNDWLFLGLNVPAEPSPELIGRSHEMGELLEWMQQHTMPRTMLIYGLGGIGKTALTYHAIKIALQQGIVNQVIWTSAKKETFVQDRIEFMPERSDFHIFLTSNINTFLNIEHRHPSYDLKYDIPSAYLHDLRDYFQKNKTILVIDNVESLADFDKLQKYLPEILGESKAIITGRFRVELTDTVALRLKGLDEPESITLLQWEAKNLGITQPEPESWRTFYKVAGGSPLVLKLGLNLLTRSDHKQVIYQLTEGRAEIYNYIYRHVLETLSPLAKSVLIYLSKSVTPVPKAIINERVNGSEHEVIGALDELNKVSLIETNIDAEYGEVVYVSDALTKAYVQETSLR